MGWTIAVLGIGVVGHGVLVVALVRYFLHPPRLKVQRTPAEYGLEYRDVTLTSADDVKLKGWYVPGSGPAGIVLCHGYPGCREDIVSFLPWLHRAGFHVLAFDFRALGESGGNLCTFGEREKHDVETAAALLAKQPGVDPQRIGAMGLSMGGACVLLAAAETPMIRAVVTDSAFARMDEMVVERFRPVPALYRGALSTSVRICAERWGGYRACDIVPVAAIRAIPPRPILLIHGTADSLVPVRHGRMLHEAAGKSAEYWEVSGAAHVRCHAAQPEEYERRVVAFFTEALTEEAVGGKALGVRR